MIEQTTDGKPKIKKPLKILAYPDPKLRRFASRVNLKQHLPEIQQLSDLMMKTMKFFNTIGLSAPQVGVSFRMFVIVLQDGVHPPMTMINPEMLKTEGKMIVSEGCLSLPTFHS